MDTMHESTPAVVHPPPSVTVGFVTARPMRPPTRRDPRWYWRADAFASGQRCHIWAGRGTPDEVRMRLHKLTGSAGEAARALLNAKAENKPAKPANFDAGRVHMRPIRPRSASAPQDGRWYWQGVIYEATAERTVWTGWATPEEAVEEARLAETQDARLRMEVRVSGDAAERIVMQAELEECSVDEVVRRLLEGGAPAEYGRLEALLDTARDAFADHRWAEAREAVAELRRMLLFED